jgi:tetratricopeptide (TPR) repeat protein
MNYKEAVESNAQELKKAFILKMKGDCDAALSMLSSRLLVEEYPDLKRGTYQLMATLKEDLGRLDEAIADLLSSYSLIPPAPIGAATFAKSTIEVSIGKICEKQSKIYEAINWYKKALKTISDGEGTSGGLDLKCFITIVGEENLSDDERLLCSNVVSKSWKLLRIEEEPDLSNLLKAAEKLIQAQGKPRPRN